MRSITSEQYNRIKHLSAQFERAQNNWLLPGNMAEDDALVLSVLEEVKGEKIGWYNKGCGTCRLAIYKSLGQYYKKYLESHEK